MSRQLKEIEKNIGFTYVPLKCVVRIYKCSDWEMTPLRPHSVGFKIADTIKKTTRGQSTIAE